MLPPKPSTEPWKDWSKIDKELAPKVESAAKEILDMFPFVMVSRSLLMQMVHGNNLYLQKMDLLPLTRKGFEKWQEDEDKFQTRRLWVLSRQMIADGTFTISKLSRNPDNLGRFLWLPS